jgi:hypothetical protein
MVEIPNKTPAAYRGIYSSLATTAAKYNDTETDLAPENHDLVSLEVSSKGLYSRGDEVVVDFQLSSGTLEVVRKNDERSPYKATLSMKKTEDGFTARESLHNRNGLVEREFLIKGDEVEVTSESRDRSTPYEPKESPRELSYEIGGATDTLQYLIGPGFKR